MENLNVKRDNIRLNLTLLKDKSDNILYKNKPLNETQISLKYDQIR